jgi:signal transduction histidine kinase/ActR/RegA family two-component response regulator
MSPEPGEDRARLQREAEVIAQIARSINASLDLDVVLQRVADGARDLCGSDLSAIALREPETGDVVFRYRSGHRRYSGGRLVVLPGRGAGGHVLATGTPFRSDDLLDDPRVALESAYLEIVRAEGVVTIMVVPIAIAGQLQGLLYVDNRAPRPFTDRDERILLQLADHAGIAISNAQLLQQEQRARADAEAANRLKDEFLANLSHELRTPLNAILGWAVMLRGGQLDPDVTARALESIERNARAQQQLIEDLLDMARITSGKLRLDVRVVDLVQVIEAALDTVRPAADAKSLHLHAVLDPRAGPVSGDPSRLQQVIWNLLSNAIKFTAKGGRVQIRLQRVNSHVEIVASDSGSGIAADLLPHVFERFRQADSTSARHQGGLGIGLALVKHLVEQHGGTVSAASPGPGLGATFTVKLPMLLHPYLSPPDAVHPTAWRNAAAPSRPLLPRVKVLVVDDEPDTLALFRGILAESGAEVREADSVTAAMGVLADWRPDVLVTDIGMPGEDGYGLIDRVRALDAARGSPLPAVAVTAYDSLQDRIRILSAGFQFHLPKPVEPAELLAVVASLTGRNAGQR